MTNVSPTSSPTDTPHQLLLPDPIIYEMFIVKMFGESVRLWCKASNEGRRRLGLAPLTDEQWSELVNFDD